MSKRFKNIILSLLLLNKVLYSQIDSTVVVKNQLQNKEKKQILFKPTIGLGVGVFSFYGDIYQKQFNLPSVSKIAYDLNVAQRISDNLQVNFYILFGKVSANERNANINRNLNFESELRAGGLNFEYNFGNFLLKNRTVSPFITLGIESFEFLSKTDLYDRWGNQYHYWADGSIRTKAESAVDANDAALLQRDYRFETDIRQSNVDGFGKYAERSWAIPVGIGAVFKVNDYINFKLGTTMHFTFTDYIDGITKNSIGDRAGNSQMDRFMMTSMSLHYNFGIKSNEKNLQEELFENVDFFALDNNDSDKDGVIDAKDSCQGTPIGIAVNVKGCPLDDDRDGVPNSIDDELNSLKGAFVDGKGVTLSDSLIDYQYRFYMDSTGAFAKTEIHIHNGNTVYKAFYNKEYTVQLGVFKQGLSNETLSKYLSIKDVSSTKVNDSTNMFTAGKFTNPTDAKKRKSQLDSLGFTDTKLVYKQNGKYYGVPANYEKTSSYEKEIAKKNTSNKSDNNKDISKNNTQTKSKNDNKKNSTDLTTTTTENIPGVVFRVQLGAYSKPLSKNVFKNVDDLIEVKTSDGLYKYMTGSFSTFENATQHKVNLFIQGFQDAFITAYKDGKSIPLKEAGVTNQNNKLSNKSSDTSSSVNSVDKTLVTFKVQLGAFKNTPPIDKQEKINKIKGVTKEPSQNGLVRYVAGSFNDLKSAEALKKIIIQNGIEDAFIIAFFNNEQISIQKAIELTK